MRGQQPYIATDESMTSELKQEEAGGYRAESHCASTSLPPAFYSIQCSTSQLSGCSFTDRHNSRSGTTDAGTADSTVPGWSRDIVSLYYSSSLGGQNHDCQELPPLSNGLCRLQLYMQYTYYRPALGNYFFQEAT